MNAWMAWLDFRAQQGERQGRERTGREPGRDFQRSQDGVARKRSSERPQAGGFGRAAESD